MRTGKWRRRRCRIKLQGLRRRRQGGAGAGACRYRAALPPARSSRRTCPGGKGEEYPGICAGRWVRGPGKSGAGGGWRRYGGVGLGKAGAVSLVVACGSRRSSAPGHVACLTCWRCGLPGLLHRSRWWWWWWLVGTFFDSLCLRHAARRLSSAVLLSPTTEITLGL